MDTFTKEQRSRCMSRIRSRDTKPELVVRKVLTELGWKYRLHVKGLPGKPDIIIRKKEIVFFINGCFWHQHKGCKRQYMPKSNTDYWANKLNRNIERQEIDIKALKDLGWTVEIIWECQTKDISCLTENLKGFLNEK